MSEGQNDSGVYVYDGDELELFSVAVNWKSYWMSVIKPFVTGDVLEVGAGLGALTKQSDSFNFRSWTALEPDLGMAAEISRWISGTGRDSLRCFPTTLSDNQGAGDLFDAVLYIDVLEHIENDQAEMRVAARALKPGGHLIVLAPAHRFLFSPFDAAVGHYRRYSKKSLLRVAPADLEVVMCCYLDSVGMLASIGNRFLTRQAMPKVSQISFWDQRLIPLSRRIDPVLRFHLGKSVIGIWRKSVAKDR